MKTGFEAKQWVCDGEQLGRIKEVEIDGTLDIVIYDRQGNRIGRSSPAMGGPRGFEPCCNPDTWAVIEAPHFPLTRYAYLNEVVTFVPQEDATHV